MRANGLVGAHTSKWRRGRPDAGGIPDLLNRQFHAPAPNQRWVADVTEFPTGEGKLFLAGVRDLFHRGIVGWDTSARQDTVLVVFALTMALTSTGRPADVVHHVDKGSIYTSLDFAFAAGNADMQLSFGSTGDAYDNAAMETFWERFEPAGVLHQVLHHFGGSGDASEEGVHGRVQGAGGEVRARGDRAGRVTQTRV